MQKRVFGYARVSSAEQARGSSLEDQQRAIRAYAEARGLTVTRFFVEAESAVRERIEHRVQIRALLDEVRAGDLVVVDKLDRWSRDAEFSYASIRQILERGAKFYAVGDTCDPSTPEGDSMMSFRILFAREEHKRIKARMVGTRRLLADRGYYSQGLPPFGYRRSNDDGPGRNVLVVHEAEAETVRRVFALCIDGRPVNAIARDTGLHRDSVWDVLHRRTYLGEVRSGAGEWITGRHPAIIDPATFAAAQDALASRRNAGAAYRSGQYRTNSWICRDVATCTCGAKMSSAYGGSGGEYYRCTRRCGASYVPVRAAEAAVEPLVLARLVELRTALAQGTQPEAPARDYAAELSAVDKKRRRVIDMYEDGAIDRATMRSKLEQLAGQRARIEADAATPRRLDDAAARRALLGDVRALHRAWAHATGEQRRVIVTALAEAVQLPGPVVTWRSAEALTVNVAPGITYARRHHVDRAFPARKRGGR